MAVYDRWHKTPEPGDEPCRCGRGKSLLYPSAAHLRGDRWQVRWYDDEGRQRKRNFRLREGRNPDLHADAFWARIERDLDTGDYTDPDGGEVTFRAYAEDWRRGRVHDRPTAERLEARLRLHAYPVIGDRKMRDLAKRPSLTQSWISGLTCAPGTAVGVVADVAAVYDAAIDDGIISRNPVRAKSVTRPARPRPRTVTWTLERVEAVSAALPARYAVVPYLGAGTGARQGEIFGLGAGDIRFLGKDPRVHIGRQLKLIGNVPYFAPVKNRRAHSVPLAPALAARLARHMEAYPPAEVTLPWWDPRDRQRHLKPVTVRLILADRNGRPVNRRIFDDGAWRPALERAGVVPKRERGQRRPPSSPDDGMHVLRHTAASNWLRQGVDAGRVAEWLGDTVKTVLSVYVHFLPGGGEGGREAVEAFFAGQGAPEMPSRDAGEAT